jgi:hypothetical protein
MWMLIGSIYFCDQFQGSKFVRIFVLMSSSKYVSTIPFVFLLYGSQEAIRKWTQISDVLVDPSIHYYKLYKQDISRFSSTGFMDPDTNIMFKCSWLNF